MQNIYFFTLLASKNINLLGSILKKGSGIRT